MVDAPETRLFDEVNAWSYERGKNSRVSYAPSADEAKLDSHMLNYRTLIRKAQQFYLDNDFLDTAVQMSMGWEKANQLANIARLPYPVMWLEIDLHAKAKAISKYGQFQFDFDESFKDVPKRMGFLFQELNAETGFWAVTQFTGGMDTVEIRKDDVVIDPVVWMLSPEGQSVEAVKPPKPWQRLRTLYPDYFRPGIEAVGIGVGANDAPLSVLFLPWIENRIQMCMEPLHRVAARDTEERMIAAHEIQQAEMVRSSTISTLDHSLTENRGTMRLLITILALMNQAPDVTFISKTATGHRMKNMRNVPYLGHSVVHLKLPKTKPITRLEKILDVASADRRRNRAHKVRGHFRQIERGNPLPFKCDHAPTLVENGVGICIRCERMIKWIPNHDRGDAGLGWVNHEYVVEAA